MGDTAETLSLIWPNRNVGEPPSLAAVVETLGLIGRNQLQDQLAQWLDTLDVNGRWALLKLVTGGMRTGVSARLAKLALATRFDKPIEDIEEVWHGVSMPYAALFAWLSGTAPRPESKDAPVFRPLMLSTSVGERRISQRLILLTIRWNGNGMAFACSCAPAGVSRGFYLALWR